MSDIALAVATYVFTFLCGVVSCQEWVLWKMGKRGIIARIMGVKHGR